MPLPANVRALNPALPAEETSPVKWHWRGAILAPVDSDSAGFSFEKMVIM